MRHKHLWKIMFSSAKGTVEQCLRCPSISTVMWDFSKRKSVRLDGNFLTPLFGMGKLFILAKDIFSFQEAVLKLREKFDVREYSIIYLDTMEKISEIGEPVIYFYKDWWESPLAQDQRLTNYLNRWS